MKSILLFSPGIDSFLALKKLEKNNKTPTQLIHYALGSRYSYAELYHIQKLMIPVSVDTSLTLTDIEKDNAYIPNRNLLMAMHAAGKYDADIVYIGGTLSDRVSDNNESIMNNLSNVVSESLNKKVTITSPFWNEYKVELAKEFSEQNSNAGIILQGTFSCYKPIENKEKEPVECNRCKACFRKSVILYSIGINRSFKTPHIINKYKKEFINCKESTPRSKATLEYINWLETRKT